MKYYLKMLYQKRDPAGEERFRSVSRMHFRGALGALFVYDVTDRSSFENVSSWLNDIERYSCTDTVIHLIGNKSDLRNSREVTYDEAKEFADERDLLFAETSAKM